MFEKLAEIERTHDELTARLADPEIHADRKAYTEASKALSDISRPVELYRRLKEVRRQLAETDEMLQGLSRDDELYSLARDEHEQLAARQEELEEELRIELTPTDPNDRRNVVLEIRAGTGGDEATLFAGELFRMYSRYAERQGWRVEVIDLSESGVRGVKEVSAIVEGRGAYSRLKYEAGVHRVQRVPETEASGRIHTSAVTVAVLPEAEDVEVELDESEIRVDRFCASGPGGQGVNTTYSAVRLTHLPTGIVVSCQDERSQIKNKAKALRVLKARLLEIERAKAEEAVSEERRKMVGSGDRSEKIRTYNFPQNRVTDHRIGVTVHQLPEVLEGNLDALIEPLATHFQTQRLQAETKAS
ncbi:MAG TPA: peptide chain release factor 1 [Thermoanaerobaculia bacterium]